MQQYLASMCKFLQAVKGRISACVHYAHISVCTVFEDLHHRGISIKKQHMTLPWYIGPLTVNHTIFKNKFS
jgi:hypothetical protein